MRSGQPDVDLIAYRFAAYSAILLAAMTAVTFGFALSAVPISGAFCPADCREYPYLNTLTRYPRDYWWMFFASAQVIIYLVFMSSVHSVMPPGSKIFSRISLALSAVAVTILSLCYFIQYSVIPASLMTGQTEGLSLLTQYNPHGIFIAMEELGYLIIAVSFVFAGFAFAGGSRLELAIRWIYLIAFAVTLLAFIYGVARYGVLRKDRFEVFVISTDWLVFILNGILTGVLFHRFRQSHFVDTLSKTSTFP